MNYGDHNFIEITPQTKLRIEPVELDFVERVDRLAQRSRARRVEPSGIRALGSSVRLVRRS